MPALIARIGLSAAWTTASGVLLAAWGIFSLPRVVVLAGMVTLVGYAFVGRVRREGRRLRSPTARGLVIALLAGALFWPAYEPHLFGQDASTYLAGATHLARTHSLAKDDPLAAELTPSLRRQLFRSLLGRADHPPYGRMLGSMVLATPDSAVAYPNFFPAPMVWAALFADSLGARQAGLYAPLFAALAVWAFWLFARRRLEPGPAFVVTALVALNAAGYYFARLPLSEPLAWFFLWVGLVALDAWEEDGHPADARLAGLFLGTVGFVRPEYVAFLGAAIALRMVLAHPLAIRPCTFGFYGAFAVMAMLTGLEVWLIPGAYTTPIVDALAGVRFRLRLGWALHPMAVALAGLTVAGLGLVLRRRLGWLRTIVYAGVAVMVLGLVLGVAHPRIPRSLDWLGAYLGVPTLVIAVAGLCLVWRERHSTTGDGFFLLLVCMIGGLLIYNPHVLPSMPWAIRRFVPFLIPSIVLLAALACTRLVRRSHAAGILAWLAVLLGALIPARGLWGHDLFAGTYEQVEAFDDRIPAGATLLVDDRLVTMQLGTAIWLGRGRDALPVDATSRRGRNTITVATHQLAGRGPVYLLEPAAERKQPILFVNRSRQGEFGFDTVLPEQTTAKPPVERQRFGMLVSIDRLTPMTFGRKPSRARTPPAD